MSDIRSQSNHQVENSIPPHIFWIMGLVMNILFVIVAGILLLTRYQSHLHISEERLENLAAIYDDNVLLLMQNLESMMRAAGTEYLNQQQVDNLDQYLGSTVERLPHLEALFVVNSDGIIVADSAPENNTVGNNNSDGILFTAHIDSSRDFVFVRHPFDRDSNGTWVIPISYGIHDETGQLLTVIVAAINANYFSGNLSASITDEDQIIGYLFDNSQTVLATIPFQEEQLNMAYPEHDVFTQIATNAIRSQGFADPKNHIIAAQIVEPYDFVIVFTQPHGIIIEAFLFDAMLILAGAVLLGGITIIVLGYLAKQTKTMLLMMETLHRTDYEFRTLAENVSDIIVRFDRDLRHIYVNPALLRTTGLTAQDYLGKTNRELGMPDQQVSFWDQETRLVFESKQENIIEFEYESIDGKRYFQGRLTPEFDEQGSVETVLSVVRDITALKQTQAQLEDQKSALQTQYRYQHTMTQLGLLAIRTPELQHFMDQFVATIAEALDVEYTKILELTPDETQLLLRSGVGWQDGIVGTAYVDNEEYSQAGYTLSIAETVVVYDLPNEKRFQGPQLLTDHNIISGMSTIIQTRKGRYGILGIHSRRQRVFDDHDVEFLQGVTGLLSSVIEYKWAEQSAIQERNLLRTVIDNVPDNIFVKDTEERFIETNLAHANAGGVSRDEMIGHTATEFFDTALTLQFHKDDVLVLQNGQAIINKERLSADSAGNQRWMLTTKVPLHDDKGKIIGLIGISRDITERRQAEFERQETEKLQLEMEQERQLLELKERFIASASHNFRTPLAIISSGKSLLDRYLERYSPDEQRDKLDKIQIQVDHMTRLLDDVLKLHKLNTGKVNLMVTQFDLRALCERVWDDMCLLDADRHPKDFQYLTQEKLIVADESILQQIIHNLLSNAFKYTPDGKSIIFQIDSDDRWFVLTVKDNGIGIPEIDQAQLFQPFHRASNTNAIQGTGLGLAIIKEYVELHQGQITVESSEGNGTIFTVHLPINSVHTD